MRSSCAAALCALLAASLACGTSQEGLSDGIRGGGAPDDEEDPSPQAPSAGAALLGRFERGPDGGARFSWSLSSIEARFTGERIAVDLREEPQKEETNRFLVFIDEDPPFVAAPRPGRHVLLLADGLDPGAHRVRLVRRTEAMVGPTTFYGFVLDEGGALLPPPPPRPRRVEVLGDSLTTGYGNLGGSVDCPYSVETQDGTRAYAALAAEELGAEVCLIAWSGKGVLRNYDPSDIWTLPLLWDRAVPQDPDSVWSFEEPEPDAVVVHLGTNDFAAGAPPEDDLVQAYLDLLEDVRSRRPTAALILVAPPLTDDWPEGGMHRTRMLAALERVRAARRDVGDEPALVELTPPLEEEGLGCAWHPTLETHRRWAGVLAEAIRAAAGW